jgi:hypothetical protein
MNCADRRLRTETTIIPFYANFFPDWLLVGAVRCRADHGQLCIALGLKVQAEAEALHAVSNACRFFDDIRFFLVLGPADGKSRRWQDGAIAALR